VEETGVPEENERPVASHWQTCLKINGLKCKGIYIYFVFIRDFDVFVFGLIDNCVDKSKVSILTQNYSDDNS